MSRRAIIVCEELQVQEQRLVALLDFFGVPWQLAGLDALYHSTPDSYCAFASMGIVGKMLKSSFAVTRAPLLRNASATYLYGGGDTGSASYLLQQLTGCSSAQVAEIQDDGSPYVVAKGESDVCGPLSGLTVPSTGRDSSVLMQAHTPALQTLISKGSNAVFCKTNLDGLRCFLDPCPEMIDISSPVDKSFFDVRDHFAASLPIVMFLRYAFREIVWTSAGRGACVVMDDAVLRPSYGFFKFEEVSQLGREHGFSCSIGFIPWNWRRSNPSVVDLMKRHSDTFSLCVHGCDHSRGEFATDSLAKLDSQTKLAMRRMERHQELTGLKHERVMVFPQGLFSAEAPGVLKRNGFLAAINTDVSPTNRGGRTEIRELWQTAITKYADFPIYTRRYPFHGLWNFAFDLLLGKPCLIATHHDDFHDNCRDLIDLVLKINALEDPARWRPIGDVIRNAYSRRLRQDGGLDLKMFGNEVVIKNPSTRRQTVVITKGEHDPEQVERVEIDGQSVGFLRHEHSIQVEISLDPAAQVLVAVRFWPICAGSVNAATVTDRFKLAARRYLSEFRDEALVHAPRATALAVKTHARLLHPSQNKHA
jgi:hypothetical protein